MPGTHGTGPMYAMIEREAKEAGLPLNWPARIPNSRPALAAAEWACRHVPAAFNQLHKELFQAHFVLSEDIEDPGVIGRHAIGAKINIANDAVRKPMFVTNCLKPAGFVDRSLWSPHGRDVHGFGHALRFDVVDELFNWIVAPYPKIVAEHARDRRIGQPRNVLAQPDMMMGVDRRSFVGHFASLIVSFRAQF